ncbi:MAG: polysaccharide biosynthesis tyrosine autokinase [Flavobacteriaceae bacterium]
MDNPQNSNSTHSQNEPTLREQIEIYLRHWPWFIITVLITLTVAYLYLRYSTPFYQSTTSIIIKDSKGRGAASELAAFEDIGLISGMNTNSIENEIEILRSRRLLRNVVDELNLNIRYFREGKIKTSELFLNLPFKVKILEESNEATFPNYQLQFKILSPDTFQFVDEGNNLSINAGFGDKIELPYGAITVIPNPEALQSLKKDDSYSIQVQVSNPENIVSYYRQAIQVNPVVKNSSVIQLTLNDPVKDKAEAILNELVVQYNKDAIEDRNMVATNTAQFIEERLQIITKELDSVETDKVIFKQENNLTDIESEAQLFLESASELNKRQLELTTQKTLVENIISYLTEDDLTALLPSNMGISEEGLQGLIQNYNQLVLERNKLLRSSTEQNPVVVNLANQIDQLKGNVLRSLNNVKSSLDTSLRDLRRQEGVFDSKITQVPDTEKEFRNIVRQQNIKEALYLFLLQKREETSLSLAVTAPKAKIVDHAHSSSSPVSPKPNIILLAALLLGLLIPFLIIYLNQLLYNKVSNRKDVERVAPNISLIGEIPKLARGEEELIQKNDTSVLAESFRILRTNLQYLFANKDLAEKSKTIFVTSTVKGEGKTFISVNLALTLSNVGKKVILVGADIRNPQLHRFIQDTNTMRGVTDFLVQPELTLDELIHKSHFNTHLDILFSGNIPPNPAELLLNDRVAVLFENLKQHYDYIIVDTAPSMLVTDTLLINKFADVTLYVIRADYTERRLLEFPVDCVEDEKLKAVSFILNNVRMANFGYGNKYGYAYGVEKKGFFKKLFNF